MLRFDEQSATWVFAQQAASRSLVAFKFFLLARLLGPQSIGLIAACLMALSIAESLTEMGFGPALVQRRELLGQKELDALWTATMMRGLLLSIILVTCSSSIAHFMNVPEGAAVLRMVALVPLARCLVSVKVMIAQRERHFRTLALFTTTFVAMDFMLSAVAAFSLHNVLWIVAALPLSELFKSVTSHIVFSTRPRIDFNSKPLRDVMKYGRWVWVSSLLTIIVNQLDRIITVKFFGVPALGTYQTASRLAQFGVADFGIALSQYLFPNFAELSRQDENKAAEYAMALFSYLGTVALVVATFLYTAAPDLVDLLLGGEWRGAVPFFRVFLYLMAAGVLVGLLTAYLRGSGRPSRVTRATAIQLVVLLSMSAILAPLLGAIGVACAAAISVMTCLLVMLYDVLSTTSGQARKLLPFATVGLPLSLSILGLDYALSSIPYHMIVIGFLSAIGLMSPLLRLRAEFSLTV